MVSNGIPLNLALKTESSDTDDHDDPHRAAKYGPAAALTFNTHTYTRENTHRYYRTVVS